MLVGLNRGDLVNAWVCLVMERLERELLMVAKGATDFRQYFYFINICYFSLSMA